MTQPHFTDADHERARRAGQQAMAKLAPKPARERKQRRPHPGWRKFLSAAVWFAAVTAATRPAYHAAGGGIVGGLAVAGVLVAAFIVAGLLWPHASAEDAADVAQGRPQ